MMVIRRHANNGTTIFAKKWPNERQTETQYPRKRVCYQFENYREERTLPHGASDPTQPEDNARE
jgi:hypothetical protein